MIRMHRYGAAAAGALMCFLSQAALADQGTGLYIGGGFGWANHGEKCDFGSVTASSCDTNSTGAKAFLGVEFNDVIGIEAGYYGLGETRANPGGSSFKFEPIGLGIQGVGFLRLSKEFVLLPKIGAFFWDADTTVNGLKVNDNGTSLVFGIGAEYTFARNLSVRLEAEFFPSLGDENTVGKADISLISTSLVLRF